MDYGLGRGQLNWLSLLGSGASTTLLRPYVLSPPYGAMGNAPSVQIRVSDEVPQVHDRRLPMASESGATNGRTLDATQLTLERAHLEELARFALVPEVVASV